MITITNEFVHTEIDRLELDYFGLRNWEPARKVGVRRTIADCGFRNSRFKVLPSFLCPLISDL